MKDTFYKALRFVFKWEGARQYSADPDDAGGETYWGILRTEYDAWRKEHSQPVRGIRQMWDEYAWALNQGKYDPNKGYDEVMGIYNGKFWQPMHGDETPTPVDVFCFDTAVNMGVIRMIGFLQAALIRRGQSLAADGKMGATTLAALGATDQAKLLGLLFDLRTKKYHEIATYRNNVKFLPGWLNRVSDLKSLILPDNIARTLSETDDPVVPVTLDDLIYGISEDRFGAVHPDYPLLPCPRIPDVPPFTVLGGLTILSPKDAAIQAEHALFETYDFDMAGWGAGMPPSWCSGEKVR